MLMLSVKSVSIWGKKQLATKYNIRFQMVPDGILTLLEFKFWFYLLVVCLMSQSVNMKYQWGHSSF